LTETRVLLEILVCKTLAQKFLIVQRFLRHETTRSGSDSLGQPLAIFVVLHAEETRTLS